jgi:GNAT superfamily N-acetyltransferase
VTRAADAVRAQVARVRRVGLARVPGRVVLRARRRLGLSPVAEMRMYVYALDAARALGGPAVMRRDAVDDLLAYAPAADGDAPPRAAFLAEAWQRLARGEHVYTRAVDGTLAHYGWVVDRAGPAYAAEVGQWWEAQPGTSNLYDFYTYPRFRGRGLYGQALRHIVGEVAHLPHVRHVVIWVLADNAPSRAVIEKVGFVHHLSLVGRPRPAPASSAPDA